MVNKEKSLLGIITDGDLRRMLEKGIQIDNAKAIDVLSRNPKTIESGELAVRALQIMQQNSITQLVVIKEGKVHGFIHLHDLLKEGIV